MPSLFGSSDVLDKAKELATNEKSLKAIEKLEEVYSILVDYGVADYISFDLGMLSNFNYYTAIIFTHMEQEMQLLQVAAMINY